MEQRPQQVIDGERGAVDQARTTTGAAPPTASRDEAVPWTSLVDRPDAVSARRAPPTVGRVVGRFVAANLVGVVLLLAASVWASRQAAQDEALSGARHTRSASARAPSRRT